MAREQLGITEIAGQLAAAMPTRGVEEQDAKQAIRTTLHYAKDVGILDQLAEKIVAESGGDVHVAKLCEALRDDD